RFILEEVRLAISAGVHVVVDESALESEEVVEPVRVRALCGRVPEMPLADERGRVAVVLQQLRQRSAGGDQPAFAAGPGARQRRLDRVALLIAAGDEAGARG